MTTAHPAMPPPPAYTETDRMFTTSYPINIPPPTPFGPTPISQQRTVLPYYDPQSLYSTRQATSRARWRFFAAIVWAFCILWLMGLISVGSVKALFRR